MCTKLAPVEYRGGNTSRTPSAITSAGTVAVACKLSMPRLALVKAERANLRDDLMHVFVHQILPGREMCKLLLRMLA